MCYTVNLFKDYWQLCIKNLCINDRVVWEGYKEIGLYSG
jgi:hypothetical protein